MSREEEEKTRTLQIRNVRNVVRLFDLPADCGSERNAAGGGSLDVTTCLWGDSRSGSWREISSLNA